MYYFTQYVQTSTMQTTRILTSAGEGYGTWPIANLLLAPDNSVGGTFESKLTNQVEIISWDIMGIYGTACDVF